MNIVSQHRRLVMQKRKKEKNVRNWNGNLTKVQMQDGAVIVEMLIRRTLNLELCVQPRKPHFIYKCSTEVMTDCFSCPAWTNRDDQHISATSTCQEDGTWSTSQPAPPGSLMFPASLPSPTDPDLPCTCPDLSLTYNPNTEAGTNFYCTDLSLDKLPATLTSNARCYLLCGFMLTATISCRS